MAVVRGASAGNVSVGVMGDQRTYAYTCAIRAVTSEDGMTADWVPLPHEVLKTISSRIVNENAGINRVMYDILPNLQARLSGSSELGRSQGCCSLPFHISRKSAARWAPG